MSNSMSDAPESGSSSIQEILDDRTETIRASLVPFVGISTETATNITGATDMPASSILTVDGNSTSVRSIYSLGTATTYPEPSTGYPVENTYFYPSLTIQDPVTEKLNRLEKSIEELKELLVQSIKETDSLKQKLLFQENLRNASVSLE